MATILVTGGAGYIGAHAAKALAAAGHTPVVYDNLVTGHREAVRWGPFEEGDIADAARLADVLAHHRPEAVMHFAAFAYIGESIVAPYPYYRNNVAGTLTLLEAMRAADLSRIVFSSTCATYGIPDTMPVVETMWQRPINPYGRSKLMMEEILSDAASAYGLNSVALRYFNAAGASQDGEIGEDHDPETHLIPLVLQAAKDPSRAIKVLGTDYDTPDGTCIRDYIHVEDLARAHVAALERLLDAELTGFTGINLGTGRGYSVREVIGEAKRLTNRDIRVEETPRRPGDPPELVSDPSKAAEVLGWRAEVSDVETMIGSAWRWMNR